MIMQQFVCIITIILSKKIKSCCYQRASSVLITIIYLNWKTWINRYCFNSDLGFCNQPFDVILVYEMNLTLKKWLWIYYYNKKYKKKQRIFCLFIMELFVELMQVVKSCELFCCNKWDFILVTLKLKHKMDQTHSLLNELHRI